jgi:uncharacterized protein (DUF1330 family)
VVGAYVIAIVTEAHDDAALDEYRRRNTAAVEAAGGHFLVRGGDVEVLEGDWDPLRVVVMAFDDVEAARGWYTSEAYEAAKPLRLGASTTQLIIVDGVR